MRMAVDAVPMTVRNWACQQMDGSAVSFSMVPADVLRWELEKSSAAGGGGARPAWFPHANVGRRLVEVEIAASPAPPAQLEESEHPAEPAHAIAFAGGGAADLHL